MSCPFRIFNIMIKLTSLLLEIVTKPKAIFIAGPAGSGKGYISKQLLPSNFITINSDDTYEELLKASGIGLKQKDFTPDQLSQASKFQSQARKDTQNKLEKSIKDKNNLIIDSTGGSSNVVLKKKQELEDLGYECLMVMVYTSPITSLQRNIQRDRSLMPSIVLRSWRDVNTNIDVYKQAFGNNFILVNNDPKDASKGFSQELIEPFFKDTKATGKPKTAEEEVKSKAEREKLMNDIKTLINKIPKFDSLESAKTKINNFIK